MAGVSPARRVAFDVLRRVESGAWASELLRHAARPLSSADAALASEIVFGCLRFQAQLDCRIQRAAGRPPGRLDSEVRVALRMGLYQIHHLSRVPAHAAVDESVELVRKSGKRSACGFVNAVLRKEPALDLEWPDEATRLSMPAWLLERWSRKFGTAAARRMAEDALAPPDVYVRAHAPSLVAHLKVEATEVPGCYKVLAGEIGNLRRQDISSQWVVTRLDLRPGLSFLDVCAAPGNKTAQALEAGVRAVACDRHWRRLVPMKTLDCDRVALDAAATPLPFKKRFDRILVDVPCSGTGTLARNPEIKWRLKPEDLLDLQQRQAAILRHALDCLAPGGLLVYSTCSLEEEENEDVVRKVLGRLPTEVEYRLPGLQPGDGFFLAVIRSE